MRSRRSHAGASPGGIGQLSLRAGALLLAGILALLLPGPHTHAGLTLPPGAQSGIAKTYHIQGGGSLGYDFSKPAGQSSVASCDVPVVNFYRFSFDGTLDTPSMTMTGAITANQTQGDPSDPYSWPDNSFGCGTPDDQKAIDASWYYVQPASTFRGSYQFNSGSETLGTFHLSGQVQIVGRVSFQTCDEMKAPSQSYVHQDCSTIYDYGGGQNTPININASVAMDGSIAFIPSDTGNGPLIVQMLGGMTFPDTNWPCCMVPGANGEIDGTPQP